MAEPAQSENGWAPGWLPPNSDRLVWRRVPGAEHVSLQVQRGWPEVILLAFAADYHAYVEPLRDADSACYTKTNTVWTSNHKNATGMDLNWKGHDGNTFRLGISKERAYPGHRAAVLDELIDFYEGMIYCGGNWNIRDWMHFQLGGRTFNNPATGDFILRKIRPDGFSTFRRGDTPTPAAQDAAWVLQKATGLSLERSREILPMVRAGLLAAECTTAPRIAMWLAQVGHESASFVYTEEIAKNGRYAPYIGRTWIQITWDYNYRAFGKWCYERGLVSDPEYFVKNYRSLAELKWAGLGPAWYWTVARKTLNTLSDERNLNEVTRLINGGYNGLSDRQTRYNRANTLGDLLLNLITSGDDMAQVPQEEWDAVKAELTKKFPSRSPLRRLGEGLVDTWAGMDLNQDANLHVVVVKTLAELGVESELDLLFEVAKADQAKYPDRQKDKAIALAILADIETNKPQVLKSYLAKKGITV